MARFHERVMGVYFDDLDPYQILHNARYLLLFERTLGSFWAEIGFGELQARTDAMHLVRANSVEYLRPYRGTGKIRIRVWIEHLGTSSMKIAFRAMPIDEDVDFAIGTRVVVHIDADTWTPSPWGPDLRKRVAEWVAAGEDE
jgi:acyl-CoA thioester hydrolase